MNFASDNTAPVPPEVMETLARANDGAAPAYGADALMADVKARIRTLFDAPEAAVFLVATGTAANALSIATLCPPWGAVFCHRDAHVEADECGAPEFFTGGAKLRLVDGEHARMTPASLAAAVAGTGNVGVHNVQKGMLSLTNTTEAGAVYSPAQVGELTAIARAHGLPCHMDGARFANALVSAGCTPAEMTWKAGIDILSFGGTKNGLLGVEAVVLFDPGRWPGKAWEFELRRKRGGHLFSKHRYLSAQMLAYLEGGLWLRLAAQANTAAARLACGLAKVPAARLVHPPEANMVFAAFPRAAHRRARAAGYAYYLWPFEQSLEGPDDETLSARLVCSWNTSAETVDGLLSVLGG